jgi:hypothetical protein
MGPRQGGFVCVAPDPDHQVAVRHSAEYLSIEQERDAPEHVLFNDAVARREDPPNTSRKLIVVCHVLRFSRRWMRERI